MSHVMVPVRPTARAILLAQHAVAIAVVLLDHLGKRALIFLERDLAVAVAIEHLESAHHLKMPRLEPQPLELLQRQGDILVGIELGNPGSAILVDFLLADPAVLVGVIALDEFANLPADPAAATTMGAAALGVGERRIASGHGHAGQGSNARNHGCK